MSNHIDIAKVSALTGLLLVPTIAGAAIEECPNKYQASCQLQAPEPLHGEEHEPSIPFSHQLVTMVGTGTSTATNTPPPPRNVPQNFLSHSSDDWNWAVQENIRQQRNFVAVFANPPVAMGTQTSADGWD
jgi:hypothetical protein